METLRSKSLIFDILGAFIRDFGSWIAIADLISLMGDLGVDEQTVRSSVSRVTRRGLIEREVRDGQAGYALSPAGQLLLAEGDERIYRQIEPASMTAGWCLVSFSVPEEVRAHRHLLRKNLRWLGYGNLGSGLWIAPQRMVQQTIATVRQLGLESHVDVFEAAHRAFGDVSSLVQRCWDLDALRATYRSYLEQFEPVAARWSERAPGSEPIEAFRDYIAALHQWRKLPYLDPGLPPEFMPADWEGRAAIELFTGLRSRLEPAARMHVASVIWAR